MARVLLDCDGVIADFIGHVCSWLKTEGFTRTPEEFTDYELRDILSDVEKRALNEFTGFAGYCAAIPPYDGAYQCIASLQESFDLRVVTAPWKPSKYWISERLSWLRAHNIEERHVIFCNSKEKQYVDGDYLIEDRPETIEQWLSHSKDRRAILIDQPWNRLWEPCAGCTRVTNLEECVNLIKAFDFAKRYPT